MQRECVLYAGVILCMYSFKFVSDMFDKSFGDKVIYFYFLFYKLYIYHKINTVKKNLKYVFY